MNGVSAIPVPSELLKDEREADSVRQYAALSKLIDGSSGKLIERLPLEWAFKVEEPLPDGWRYEGPEDRLLQGMNGWLQRKGVPPTAGARPARICIYKHKGCGELFLMRCGSHPTVR